MSEFRLPDVGEGLHEAEIISWHVAAGDHVVADQPLVSIETDKAVDAKHVAIEGHSRYGKATLVAMAYDQRFWAAFVSSSGEGGAKLHRRDGENP